jgi:hypothetical protein
LPSGHKMSSTPSGHKMSSTPSGHKASEEHGGGRGVGHSHRDWCGSSQDSSRDYSKHQRDKIKGHERCVTGSVAGPCLQHSLADTSGSASPGVTLGPPHHHRGPQDLENIRAGGGDRVGGFMSPVTAMWRLGRDLTRVCSVYCGCGRSLLISCLWGMDRTVGFKIACAHFLWFDNAWPVISKLLF